MAGVSLEPLPFLSPELQRAYTTAVQAEKKPIEKLQEKKSNVDAKISLLNEVVGKIDNVKKSLIGLSSPGTFRELTLNTTDEKSLSGTVDKSMAEPGNYSLEVSQLASHAAALSNGFPDKDQTRIGSGTINFKTEKGESKEVFVDNPTLEELNGIINKSNLGIKASIVNDKTDPDNPFRLVMSGEKVGAENTLEIPEFYLTDGDQEFTIEKIKPASNAVIKYEGFNIQSPANELKDVIRGVTLNIKGLSEPGKPTTVSVDQDIGKTTQKVKDFVDKMNQVFTFIQSQNKLNDKSDTTRTLGGDYGIRVAEERLRQALGSNTFGDGTTSIHSLGDVGIEFAKNGTLTFDDKKFEATLNAHYSEVVNLFTGDGLNSGVVPKVNRAVNTIIGPPGSVLTGQQQTYTEQSRKIENDIETREKRAESTVEELKGKLSKVQSAITTMQNQSSQMQASLGGGGGESSMVSQLLGG